MILLDGKKEADKLTNKVKIFVNSINKSDRFIPALVVILVGNNEASNIYVKNKRKLAEQIGFKSFERRLIEDTSQKELIRIINEYNNNTEIDGILVQLPLPSHIENYNILNAIDPLKDVDGFNSFNIGLLSIGRPRVIPCTPLGCLILIKKYLKDLSGKKAIVIGRSNIVGKPMATLLLNENATLIIAHSKTNNLEELCSTADIVIAATGRAEMVKASWLKKDSVVIDVGINRKIDSNGIKRLVGDIDFEEAKKIVSAISPVPGGVGPMTVACLMANTLKLALERRNIHKRFNFF